MRSMPHLQIAQLRHIAQHCAHLEELSISNWHAFNGADPYWDVGVWLELSRMPRLRRVRLPTDICRAVYGRPVNVEHVLKSCSELVQLDSAVSFPDNATRLLKSPHAVRLQQLSLHAVEPGDVQRIAGACPRLRRLNLHDCNLDGLDLTRALPPTLTVLTFEECNGPVMALPVERVQLHFRSLQMLSFGCSTWDRPLLPDGPSHVPMLTALCTLPNLRVLDMPNLDLVDDTLLLRIASQCTRLHTLTMPNTMKVTADSFDTLRRNPQLLPKLRVMTYVNDAYERNIDYLFSMTPDELTAEMEEYLVELDEGDWSYIPKPSAASVRAFSAFCQLVVARGPLTMPSDKHGLHILPQHAHVLERDCFCLGEC